MLSACSAICPSLALESSMYLSIFVLLSFIVTPPYATPSSCQEPNSRRHAYGSFRTQAFWLHDGQLSRNTTTSSNTLSSRQPRFPRCGRHLNRSYQRPQAYCLIGYPIAAGFLILLHLLVPDYENSCMRAISSFYRRIGSFTSSNTRHTRFPREIVVSMLSLASKVLARAFKSRLKAPDPHTPHTGISAEDCSGEIIRDRHPPPHQSFHADSGQYRASTGLVL